ncbi:uncharacterized protein [Argopecten irradians]|uniref:uncharacterized protein isoform X2 n=1 Tax=Argopecten irradians TaxID=31199 RepID=UPI003718072F
MTSNLYYLDPRYRYKDTSYRIFLELQRRKDIKFPKQLELTAAIAEEIRVPDADRKKQNGDKTTDSENLKVVLGEWNDDLNDSSSLEDDAVPIATCNLEDSVSLLSDVSSEAVSIETSELNQRTPSACVCQVEAVVHETKSLEPTQEDIKLSNNVNVRSEEKNPQKCENKISLDDKNIPNTPPNDNSIDLYSRFDIRETNIDECGSDSSEIERDIVSIVEKYTEELNNTTLDTCTSTTKEDNISTQCVEDSYDCERTISVEHSIVNSVCSTDPHNNSTLEKLCSVDLQNNSTKVESSLKESSTLSSSTEEGNSTDNTVCSKNLLCSSDAQEKSTADSVYSPAQTTPNPVCSPCLQNSVVELDHSAPVGKTLMNIPVTDHINTESVGRQDLKDNQNRNPDIRLVANSVLVDYNKTRSSVIAESVLSPVEEDISIPELSSPVVVGDDSVKHVTNSAVSADITVSPDEHDFRKSDTHVDRHVYDNVYVGEVKCSPSHVGAFDQNEADVGRCSTPTFVPSVDRTEQIISLTLNQHRVLRRSKTLPNFSPSKKKKKLNSSAVADDHVRSPYKGDNYVFRDSYLRGSTSSSPGGLLVTDIDDPMPVLNTPKHTLSTTAVQTSFDDGSNPSSPKHAVSLSQQISIGTNTTDSLERPKTRAKRLERLQQSGISNSATTEIFHDNSNIKVNPVGHVTSVPANHITALPNHASVKSVSPNHKSGSLSNNVADENVTPSNHVTSVSKNHVTVLPFNQLTKVSTATHVNVIPSSHVTVSQTLNQSAKIVNNITPKPKLPMMEPLPVTSPAKSPVPKPSNFPENFQPKSQQGYMIHDESPEMQVVVNATSPVLLRRKPSSTRNKQRDNARKELEMYAKDNEYSKVKNESKFMDKDMSKTWDGVSRKKWKQYYAPIMQSMLQNGATTDENCNVKFGSQSLQQKTLLDQMHKKYCAYQYEKGLEIPCLAQQPLVLKPSPPPPDRMRSRSWLLKNYAITLPDPAGGSKSITTSGSKPDTASNPKHDSTKSSSTPGSPILPPSRDGTLKRRKSEDHQAYSTDSSRDTTPTAQLSPTTPESDGDLKLQPGKGDAGKGNFSTHFHLYIKSNYNT